MKKIVILLACAVSLIAVSCKPNAELQEYYASEASRLYEEVKNEKLWESQLDYMDAMRNMVACEISMQLSPKIGKDIADWEVNLYNKCLRKMEIEVKYDTPPVYGSKEYQAMTKLQLSDAYQGMADVLKLYQNRSRKGVDMSNKELCDQTIAEVLKKWPIFYK